MAADETVDFEYEVNKVQRALSSNKLHVVGLSIMILFFLPLSFVFAGGSSNGDPQTFGAYQIEFDSGPVGITIQGHASTQVVRITKEDIPSDVVVHFTESGGILHVKAAYADATATKEHKQPAGHLVATMPRYEFVHIVSDSGDISINNLSTDHLTIQTTTGAINVVNTNAALTAKSTTGDQSYTQIYGSIDASSTTGKVAVANTWGTMKLASQTGALTGKNVALAGNSSFQTTSGAISMALAYGLGRYTFDMKSQKGQLQLGEIHRTGGIRWGYGNIRITTVSDTGTQNFQ